MQARARTEALLLRAVGAETLVYDLDSHRVACLNREAAAVLDACDGRRSAREIATVVGERLGSEIDADYVVLAIQRLARSGLVEGPVPPLPRGRREAIRKLAAGTAMALPLVTSVLAPEAAEAQTCLANGTPCTASSQCCSGCCGGSAMRCRGSGTSMVGCL